MVARPRQIVAAARRTQPPVAPSPETQPPRRAANSSNLHPPPPRHREPATASPSLRLRLPPSSHYPCRCTIPEPQPPFLHHVRNTIAAAQARPVVANASSATSFSRHHRHAYVGTSPQSRSKSSNLPLLHCRQASVVPLSLPPVRTTPFASPLQIYAVQQLHSPLP